MEDLRDDWDSEDKEADEFVLEDTPRVRRQAIHGGSRPGRLPNVDERCIVRLSNFRPMMCPGSFTVPFSADSISS